MWLFHKIFLINGSDGQDDGQAGRKKSVRYEKTDRECDAPNDSLSGARAGAQRGVSRLDKIMSAFMGIP
ncbi:hypothetical protein EHZ77_17835 [Aeromonas dhakensis]|nr:hypothetical protein CK627_11830 [Aeromonas dhakensis]OBR46054.1 hypothetical protein A9196_15955 [Aeromonas dhakensis]PHS85656.1 hypothetical protein AAW03_12820 [Aeromonas dhakensis]PHS86422.1 hypothetical protein AAW02_14095 [Aeromonas dhakensis]RFS28832.1 hypothetical protein DYE42_04035 [Aeromonas dhakensis]